jgi:hypothetical protein
LILDFKNFISPKGCNKRLVVVEIHSDAFNFAIQGVQDGRPVAFESKKLSETE